MFDKVISNVTDPGFLIASVVAALLVVSMVRRDMFGIRQITG